MDSGLKQHQRYARAGGDPQEHTNFGVEPADSYHKPNSEPKGGRKSLKDHERGIGRSRGYHAEPDHGPID